MKYIKNNFEKFINSLVESYDSDVDIKWIKNKEKLIGLFRVNDKIYQITCINRGNEIWTYKFYLYNSKNNELTPELTNFNVGKMSILSTIRKGMIHLIETELPKCLIYAALDNSEARKKLYLDYSRELEKKYKFKLNMAPFGDKKVFILYKDIESDKVEYVINELINELINDI